MSTTSLTRWESTHIVEAIYAIKRGLASYASMQVRQATRVAEKIVSKPATPQFFELDIPLFRFIGYPGGKSVITPTAVAAAEKKIDDAGLTDDWTAHLESRSATVFETRKDGYLARRVSPQVALAADIVRTEIGVDRLPALEPRLCNPVAMTYRVFSSELSDEHVQTLKQAAATGQTVPFKGQPHTVVPVSGGWSVVYDRIETNYDLVRVRKGDRE